MAGYNDISFDTSSNDPILYRSRVFVGSLANQHVTREQLIEMYMQFGNVIGVTLFKGFAFIQYENEPDANRAVLATNGMHLAGQAIDVKLAMHNQKGGGGGGAKRGGGGGGAGRGGRGGGGGGGSSYSNKRDNSYGGGGGGGGGGGLEAAAREAAMLRQHGGYLMPAAKMARVDHSSSNGNEGGGSYAARAPRRPAYDNKQAALDDDTTEEQLATREMEDTMICGTCRKVYHNFIEFRDHRKAPCAVPAKPEDEPAQLVCFVCKESFAHSWTLLGHLADNHHLTVYHTDDVNADSVMQSINEQTEANTTE